MQKCHINTCLIVLSIILLNLSQYVEGGMHQKKLIRKIFNNYDASERPVANENKNMDVNVGLSIQQIVDIDEKKQTIVFSGWLDLSWYDYSLKWNPEDYGNISTISVSTSDIWVPDLLLYNSADDSFDPKSPVNAVLYNTGYISYLPPGMFKSTCLIEIYEFPFDEQFCKLKFGSWTYDDSTVNLVNQSDTAQLDTYVANGEWAMESVISYSEAFKYECCPTKYPFVMFVMHLRRRTLYFIFNFVYPCMLISVMSFLGFCLPPDAGEKIGLEMTTLLSIIMFAQLITGIIPESSLSIPKISTYFGSITVICTLCIVANVFVLILHHQNIKIQRPMPPWVDKYICGHLAKLLRMKNPSRQENKDSPSRPTKQQKKGNISESSSKSLLANVLDINDDYFSRDSRKSRSRAYNEAQIHTPIQRKNSAQADEDYSNDRDPIKRNLGAILNELKTLTQKITDDDADEEKELNWKFAAMVMDRLCMIFFATTTLISTIILMTSKNFFRFT